MSSLKASSKDDKTQNRDQIVDRYIKTVLADYPKVNPILVGAADGGMRVFGRVISAPIDSAKTVAWAEKLGKLLVE